MQFDECFDQTGATAAVARWLGTAEELCMRAEPRCRTPVGPHLCYRVAAVGVIVHGIGSETEAPEAAFDPGRLPGHVRFAQREEAIHGEGLRWERQCEEQETQRMK